MKQSNSDGIIMDDIVCISDEKPKVFPLGMRVLQLFVILLVSHNTISVFTYSLGLNVNVTHINISVLLVSLVTFLIFSLEGYDWAKLLGIGFAYIWMIYRSFEKLKNAFYILENKAIERAGNYYEFDPWRYLADYEFAVRDMTLLITIITIPIILLFVLTILRGIMTSLSFIVAFLPVVVTFALGLIPSEYQLLVFVLSSLYLYKINRITKAVEPNKYRTSIHRISIRAGYLLCSLCLLLYFVVRMTVNQDDYENITKIPEVKSEIQTFMKEFTLSDISDKFSNVGSISNQKSDYVGGINHGQLAGAEEVKFKGSNQLIITLPKDAIEEGLYLRGFAASEYKGKTWDTHGKEAELAYKRLMVNSYSQEFQPMKQAYESLEYIQTISSMHEINELKKDFHFVKGKMHISNLTSRNKNMYFPCSTNYDSVDKISFLWDLYGFSKKNMDKYELDFFYNLNVDEETLVNGHPLTTSFVQSRDAAYVDFRASAFKYRSFVQDIYTKLPEEGLERIKEDFSSRNIELGVTSLEDSIDYIKSYLHKNTEYSLSPGKLPKGEDYIEYFIYENQIGYCAHYASAATIMLRAMGYPARYVEGYKVNSSAEYRETGEMQEVYLKANGVDYVEEVPLIEIYVKDYNAHAWVEVYKDGLGWLPVEFTPAAADELAANDESQESQQEVEEATSAPTSAPTITPTPTTAPTKPPVKPTSKPEDKTEDGSLLGNVPLDNEQNGPGVDKSNKNKVIKKWISRITLAVLVFALTSVLIFAFNKWRFQRYRSLDNNKKVLFLFGEMEKLFNICGKLPHKERKLEDNLDYVKEHCSYIESHFFDNSMETVKKARFGKGLISKYDLWDISKSYRKIKEEAYKESSYKRKIFLKLLLVL